MRTSMFISALFGAFTLAQPHHGHRHLHPAHRHEKRDIHTEWVMETEWVTKTKYIDTTQTIFFDGPEPTKDAVEDGQTKGSQFSEPPSSTLAAEPAETTVKAELPPSIIPVETKPEAEPVKVNQEPEAIYPPPPQSTYSPVALASEGPSIGSGPSGSGEMTFFNVGLGACGWNDAGKGETDYIVALNAPIMGAQSNGNPFCGRKVQITYGGKTITAEIRDKCPECAPGDLDVSIAAFRYLCGGLGAGRVNMEWTML